MAAKVDQDAWRAQTEAGIDLVGLDGTLYDQACPPSTQHMLFS